MQSSSDGWIISGRGGKPVPIDTNKLKNITKVMMPISFIFEMRVSLKIHRRLDYVINWIVVTKTY